MTEFICRGFSHKVTRMGELHVGLVVDAGEVVDPLTDKVFSRFSAGAPARNRTWICGFGDRKPPL